MPIRIIETVWSSQPQKRGWVSIPVRDGNSWEDRWLEWPQDRKEIRAWITETNKQCDVYWSPLLYATPSRRTARDCASRWAWADLDDVDIESLDPKPTVLWETSPGRYQGLYLLDSFFEGKELERINRRIALATKADPSGWDAGQVLRVPGSRNHKYPHAPKGKVLSLKGPRYSSTDFDHIELPPETEVSDLEAGDFEATLDEWRDVLPSKAVALLETDPESVERGTRSDNLWQLIRLLVETGLNAGVVFTLVKGSPWNKFRGRRDEDERLQKEIAKAIAATDFPYIEPPPMEEEPVNEAPQPTGDFTLDLPKHNWLRQYIEASQMYVPQVPYAYHMACGLALLSTIVSRNVTIANVDAKLHPVLWVLLVAPSNSGKSRSYDFMMDVFEATGLYREIIPINSFSPEGLIEAVSESPRKAAWLVPDEAGGLFKSMRSRDYLAGTRELLNQMADGRIISRKTKKSEILLQNYSLSFYGTTQPEGFTSSIGQDDMSTGFLRRFFVIYRNEYMDGEWKYLPPGRDEAVRRLANGLLDLLKLVTHGHPAVDVLHSGKRIAVAQPERTDITLSYGAFRRFVDMDKKHRRLARSSPMLAPFISGASNHALKVATLLTLASYPELWMGGATIDKATMDQAAQLIEEEVQRSGFLLNLIGSNEMERNIASVVEYLQTKAGRKATRTEIQRRFGKQIGSKYDMDKLEETMVDRGLIRVTHEVRSKRSNRKAKVYTLIRQRL